MNPTFQMIEEALTQYAIDAPREHKVSAEVLRDLVTRIVKGNMIEEFDKRRDHQVEVMLGVAKAIGLLIFLMSDNEDQWLDALKTMARISIKFARDNKEEYIKFNRQQVNPC